jgi:hypothetical protein
VIRWRYCSFHWSALATEAEANFVDVFSRSFCLPFDQHLHGAQCLLAVGTCQHYEPGVSFGDELVRDPKTIELLFFSEVDVQDQRLGVSLQDLVEGLLLVGCLESLQPRDLLAEGEGNLFEPILTIIDCENIVIAVRGNFLEFRRSVEGEACFLQLRFAGTEDSEWLQPGLSKIG